MNYPIRISFTEGQNGNYAVIRDVPVLYWMRITTP